jgi:hypothetical protein
MAGSRARFIIIIIIITKILPVSEDLAGHLNFPRVRNMAPFPYQFRK